MTREEKLANIILNENAYFYVKKKVGFLTKKIIKSSFQEASKNRKIRSLLRIVKEETAVNSEILYFSVLVFKTQKKPNFIEEKVSGWEEDKIAYFSIIDFKDYLVIARKNVPGIPSLNRLLEPLDYEVLSTLFSSDTTTYEKLSMNNMDISDAAIRQKSLVASDLQDNVSPLGFQGFILNHLRLNGDHGKISISLNSSRINKFGSRNNFYNFISWSYGIVNNIRKFEPYESFISTFARPLDFESEKENLTPVAILLLTEKLHVDFATGKIEKVVVRNGDRERNINLLKGLEKLNRFQFLKREGGEIQVQGVKEGTVSINKQSITLKSSRFNKIVIMNNDGTELPIVQYLNRYSQFLITFDQPELVYSNRKLFKNDRLLGNLEAILKIFCPYNELEDVSSEKGQLNEKNLLLMRTRFLVLLRINSRMK